ncbi:MAG: exbD [Verrucomicrobiaceae bacterium]|nr:exbD [Verrucomicrobiaceae bacterium]
MARHPQLRLITEISIAPLITVVLVLLFAFMMVGPLLHEGAAVAAPVTADKKQNAAPQTTAHLVLGENKTISLEGREVAVVDLKDRLARLVKENPGVGVVVQMNRDLPVQVLVDLMNVLREAGVERTSVATVEK